jgi:hypothetical protein
MFGIRRHRLLFKITMDLSFAHGVQKRWILATLWQLLLPQIGDNPRQVPLAKHARPIKRRAWLQRFFNNQPCQGLSPNQFAATGIPKTVIITPFGLFEYLFTPFGLSNAAQTFQRMMDHTTDGLEGLFANMDNS